MMHGHHLVSKSLMALPLVSTGNPYLSMFGGRWYTEGPAGRYVNAPFTRAK